MKHKLRLGDNYGPKRTQPKQGIRILNIQAVRNVLRGCIAFIRTFFSLCSAVMRAVCVLDVCRMREILTYSTHTAHIRHARRENKGRRKAGENRKNVKESCVCTHAMAPARYGLGLALGLVVWMMQMACGLEANAQDNRLTIPLTGKVVDAVSNRPLVAKGGNMGPRVRIKDTDIALWVNERGEFDFRGVHIANGTIRVTLAGYNPAEMAFDLNHRGPFTITLSKRDTAIQLEEVEIVSTGFYQVPKERATGSFVHINNELLGRAVGSNILDRLNGVTKGLIFNHTSNGGTRFSNQSPFSIRGRSTIRGNPDPLIILDNFPYEGDINAINPEDIESVTILQDAAAASIWGARAGNGVIVLTSKKAKLEQPLQISVRGDWSMGLKPDLYYTPTIPIPEYIEMERFLYNQGAWDSRINQTYPYLTPAVEAMLAYRNGHIDSLTVEAQLDRYKAQDVRSDLSRHVYRPTALYKLALNLQTGTKNSSHYISAGYDQNVGNVKLNSSNRFSLMTRNTFVMFDDKLRIDADIRLTKDNQTAGGLPRYQVLYDRLVDEHGNGLSIGGGYDNTAFRKSYIDTAGNGMLADWNYRPIDELALSKTNSDQTTYQLNTGMDYELTDWLHIRANYQYQQGESNADIVRNERSFEVRNLINQFSLIDPIAGTVSSAIPQGGMFRRNTGRIKNHYGRAQLVFDKKWQDLHELNGMFGMEVNERKVVNQLTAWWMGYRPETETFTPFDFGARYTQYHTGRLSSPIIVPDQPSRNTSVRRNRLYVGNIAYSYLGRYTASFSLRKDEANIFGADINKRGRPFWSAGLLWRVDRETFYKATSIPKLAIRLTCGHTGNVSSASAQITSSVSTSPVSFTGRIYQVIGNPPNPQLGWENVAMVNMAIEFSALQNRLSGSVEHYRKRATDLLSSAPINPSSGVNSLYGNWSSLVGSGWDVQLNSLNVTGRLKWRSDFLFSTVYDKVTDYKLKPTRDRSYLTASLGSNPVEGKPLYSVYSYRWAGLDGLGQPMGYSEGELSQDYTDIYNNGKLSDFVFHGRATPAVFGSLRNGFTFSSIDISFNITYKLGYYFRRTGLNYSNLYNINSYQAAAFQWEYSTRWQQPGDETRTHVPVAQYPVVSARENFYRLSEVLVERADHIRLSDIRIGYQLPKKMADKLNVRDVQLYGYASNLGILWRANNLGIDPDVVPDNRSLVYPTPTTFAFGVTLNF